MHDLRHTFAVHCLEAWLRQGKDLRQKLPVLSGYMGHVLLKSTDLYLRLVPGRFVNPLSRLQASPNRHTHVESHKEMKEMTRKRVRVKGEKAFEGFRYYRGLPDALGK